MKKRKLTPEQEAARDARREKFQALARKVAAMSDGERADLLARMPAIVTIEGRALSPFNSCLVAMQNPGASIVGGFRQWIKAGRAVMKGQHGAAIWVPCGAKAADGSEGTAPAAGAEGEAGEGSGVRFITGTVFDVTQTQEIEADEPIAVVSPEIAAAFGMQSLPNVRIEEPAPAAVPEIAQFGATIEPFKLS